MKIPKIVRRKDISDLLRIAKKDPDGVLTVVENWDVVAHRKARPFFPSGVYAALARTYSKRAGTAKSVVLASHYEAMATYCSKIARDIDSYQQSPAKNSSGGNSASYDTPKDRSVDPSDSGPVN